MLMMFREPIRRTLACYLRPLALCLLMLCVLASLAPAQTFPTPRFNGLQITYTITGAQLSAPSDGGPFEGWVRTYTGQLQGDTLRMQGTVLAAPAGGNRHARVRVLSRRSCAPTMRLAGANAKHHGVVKVEAPGGFLRTIKAGPHRGR